MIQTPFFCDIHFNSLCSKFQLAMILRWWDMRDNMNTSYISIEYCTVTVIWSSWISRMSAILIVRYSPSKKTTYFVFYCFSKPTFTHISGTNVRFWWGFQQNVAYVMNITHLTLILLDHITIYDARASEIQKCKDLPNRLCQNWTVPTEILWKWG